ncbi:hypothetical protein BDZ45DRAFT_668105 [Acephala macrosclerotiorum]|nr:hypothetical protein BDZ45DRAFT_668105 [Acephala macrosclerotiorum]
MYDRTICTGDPDEIDDSLESFPSGHSTAAFAGFMNDKHVIGHGTDSGMATGGATGGNGYGNSFSRKPVPATHHHGAENMV